MKKIPKAGSDKMKYKYSYNPCDDCDYSYSKNNQEMNECKICEFNFYLNKCSELEQEIIDLIQERG